MPLGGEGWFGVCGAARGHWRPWSSRAAQVGTPPSWRLASACTPPRRTSARTRQAIRCAELAARPSAGPLKCPAPSNRRRPSHCRLEICRIFNEPCRAAGEVNTVGNSRAHIQLRNFPSTILPQNYFAGQSAPASALHLLGSEQCVHHERTATSQAHHRGEQVDTTPSVPVIVARSAGLVLCPASRSSAEPAHWAVQ